MVDDRSAGVQSTDAQLNDGGTAGDQAVPSADAAAGSENVAADAVKAAGIDSPSLTPETASAASAVSVVTVDGPSVSAPEMQAAATSATTASDAETPVRHWPLKWPALHLPTMPTLSRRARRRAAMAAGVVAAACLGATVGAVAVGMRPPAVTPAQQATLAEERAAMQKTIERLGKEVTSLRAGLDTAGKSANTQIAKLTAKVKEAEKAADEARRAAAAPETTGSIPANVPIPVPKPAIKPAANPVAAATLPVVDGWFVHSARNGRVLVEGRGELFDVVPGAPLPGLGRVEAIRRENGQWVVVTQKGLIVAMREAPRQVYRRF